MTAGPPGLEVDAVTRWLRDRLGIDPPVTFDLVAAGGSNLTFRVSDGSGHTWALRRPPVAAVLATAHDMDREWRILSALTETDVPVPTPLARCDDVEITGAPFYVMEFVDGTILRTSADAAAFDERDADTATDALVDAQVALHALDPVAVGLGDLARTHTQYVERQLRRWHTQVEQARVRPLPVLDDLHDRLARSVPPEPSRPAIVHGDYRFDNVVLGTDHRIAAVLDWELCTIGDPVADACWSLLYWIDPGDVAPFLDDAPTLAPRFPRRAEAGRRYAERSGRDLDTLGWFTVFGYWKMASIVEGVYARRLQGAGGGASPGDPESIARRVDALLERASDEAVGIL